MRVVHTEVRVKPVAHFAQCVADALLRTQLLVLAYQPHQLESLLVAKTVALGLLVKRELVQKELVRVAKACG